MDIGAGDHSPELQLALKKFEDACVSLQNEQSKLVELEARRRRLQEDLECLRNEILIEKSHVQSVIEEQNANASELKELDSLSSYTHGMEDTKIEEKHEKI